MKMRSTVIALFFLSVLTSAYGLDQIRDFVGVVRPTLTAESLACLKKTQEMLKSDGNDSLASSIDDYIMGVFGSGFVYVAPNGNNYLVTNRHVVSQAETLTVEFEHIDGTITKYENLNVVAVDENLDLALLSFPDGKRPFRAGLQLDLAIHNDGEDIWSAGFPALGNNPMWQFGKGTITNARAKVPELADPGKTFLIQHSAQVDAGNSGGPLLVTAKGVPGGYRVIGVNTWKAVSRQATNYSIPSIAVSAFIGKVLGVNDSTDESARVESRALEFSSKLHDPKKGYADAVTYISYSCTNERGTESLRKVLASAPSEVRDSIYAVFVDLSPIEAMRYSVSFLLQKDFSTIGDNENLAIESLTKTASNTYDCVYTSTAGKWTSVWMKEQGVWRVGSIQRVASADSAKGMKQVARDNASNSTKKNYWIQTPYQLLFEVSVGMSPASDHGFYFGAQVLSSMNTYLSTGVNLSTQSMDIEWVDSYTGNTSSVSARSYLAQYVVRGQVPVMLTKISIVPFAQIGLGIGAERADADDSSARGDLSPCTGYSLEVGMLAAFGSKQNLYLEIGYLYRGMKLLDDFNENLADDKAGIFAISAGFGL